MPNRGELTDAITELCTTDHLTAYALGQALQRLSILELGEVFDAVADHHSLTTDINRVLRRGVDIDLSQLRARYTALHDEDQVREMTERE